MKIKEIEIPIYEGILAFCISNEHKKITDYFNLENSLPKNIFGHSFYTYRDYKIKNTNVYLIILNFENEIPITHGIIIHEINHIGNMILNHKDIEPDFNNDEAETYLKGWIANELYLFLDQIKMLKKIKIGQITYLK